MLFFISTAEFGRLDNTYTLNVGSFLLILQDKYTKIIFFLLRQIKSRLQIAIY
jgi:hypothetical protein